MSLVMADALPLPVSNVFLPFMPVMRENLSDFPTVMTTVIFVGCVTGVFDQSFSMALPSPPTSSTRSIFISTFGANVTSPGSLKMNTYAFVPAGSSLYVAPSILAEDSIDDIVYAHSV